MKKKIIAAVLAASMAFAMPISAMAAVKPDSFSAPAQLEEANTTQQAQPLGIKEFHSHLEKRYEYGKTRFYVYYAAQVENPNPDYAIDFASLNVAIYGSDGSILKTDSETLDWVAENETYWYAGYTSIDSEGITPTNIECTISAKDWNYHKAGAANQIVRAGELAVTNVSRRGSGYDLRYTGQVTNNSQFASSMVKVIIIYKMKDTEGNEVPMGGDYTYISEGLNPGETRAFELYPSSEFTGYSSYEIIALQT